MSEYSTFNTYCLNNFSIIGESLFQSTFGDTPAFDATGDWTYASRNSAVIAFKTTLPCKGHLNWGPTSSYGNSTTVDDRYYFLHVHYITGLTANTIYHYQLSAIDENSNTITTSDRTFTTDAGTGWIDVPGTLGSPPYNLNQANKHYVLTQNINADQRAFTIAATGVVLDLNGFTVTYDNGVPNPPGGGAFNTYVGSTTATHGVYLYGITASNVRILNGFITQGVSQSQSSGYSIGFNPVILYSNTASAEVAGITAEYGGADVGGICARFGNHNVHHNVVKDMGTVVNHRDQMVKAIWLDGSAQPIHHNLVKRCRQTAIFVGSTNTASQNELYLDSWATNSFAVSLPAGTPTFVNQIINANYIFGTGYNPTSNFFRPGMQFTNNFVFFQLDTPTTRSTEYGPRSAGNGFRLTQYAGNTIAYSNVLVDHNVIIVKARNGASQARGIEIFSDPYITNCQVTNNTVKAEVQDQATASSTAACVFWQGLQDRLATSLPVIYENNTFLANTQHIICGDDYGIMGSHHVMVNNTFTKFGSDSRYKFIQEGFSTSTSYSNWIISPILGPGVDVDNWKFVGLGRREYSKGHVLYIRAKANGSIVPNALLTVTDSRGLQQTTTTDASGRATLYLLEYTWLGAVSVVTPPTKATNTGHILSLAGHDPLTVSPILFAIHNTAATPVDVNFSGNPLQPPTNFLIVRSI